MFFLSNFEFFVFKKDLNEVIPNMCLVVQCDDWFKNKWIKLPFWVIFAIWKPLIVEPTHCTGQLDTYFGCYIYPVLMYGCESWTVTEEIKRRIEAFEMWCYRRLLKISWTDRIRNLEVMRRVGVANKVVYQNICKKKLKLAEVGEMCKTLIEEAIERRKSRGRQRKMWMFNIKDWMKEDSYVSVKMRMKEEKGFMVINVRLLNRIP